MRRVIVGLVLSLAACIEQHEYLDTLHHSNGVVVDYSGNFFLFGLVGNADFPVYERCPNGVSRVTSKHTGIDTFLELITLGIYAPRSYRVECAA